MSEIVSTEGLSKRFGPVAALSDVSFSLREGEIRAVCGENGAGKSTFVKLLMGIHLPDAGAIAVGGVARTVRNPQQAQALGLALVAQELSLAPVLSVLDNIWLGHSGVPLFHRRRDLRERARQAMETIGLGHIGLDTPVGRLAIGERQLVEIARLLARDARVLILDEPTATLSDVEIERIFAALRALKAERRAVIYITHRLGEVFEICDSVTVLRNGRHVETRDVGAVDRETLIELMLGRTHVDMYAGSAAVGGAPMVTVEGLSVPGSVEDFSMTAARGRITCIAGQIGSGAMDVVRALAGLIHDATGTVTVDGRPLGLGSPPAGLARGIQFVSEDRAGEGLFLRMTVRDNLVATRLGAHTRLGVIAGATLRGVAGRVAGLVGVDAQRLRSLANELSGGNQQKLLFGRALERDEIGVLLMNEPTRGVDVGARAEIYRLMRAFCDRGYALIMTSSDLEEVVGISDVVITMYRGRRIDAYAGAEIEMGRILADITHPRASGEVAA